MKCHVVKNDEVEVLSGSFKGKRGVVDRVYPKTRMAIVKDINKRKVFIKPSEKGPGRIEEREFPIRLEKLMVVDPSTQKPCRIGRKRDANGKFQRYFKKKRVYNV